MAQIKESQALDTIVKEVQRSVNTILKADNDLIEKYAEKYVFQVRQSLKKIKNIQDLSSDKNYFKTTEVVKDGETVKESSILTKYIENKKNLEHQTVQEEILKIMLHSIPFETALNKQMNREITTTYFDPETTQIRMATPFELIDIYRKLDIKRYSGGSFPRVQAMLDATINPKSKAYRDAENLRLQKMEKIINEILVQKQDIQQEIMARLSEKEPSSSKHQKKPSHSIYSIYSRGRHIPYDQWLEGSKSVKSQNRGQLAEGYVDVLLNNATIARRRAQLLNPTEEEIYRIYDVAQQNRDNTAGIVKGDIQTKIIDSDTKVEVDIELALKTLTGAEAESQVPGFLLAYGITTGQINIDKITEDGIKQFVEGNKNETADILQDLTTHPRRLRIFKEETLQSFR